MEFLNPDSAFIKLKSLETFEKVADGNATKIIVPSEIQNMASLLSSAKEFLAPEAEAPVNDEQVATQINPTKK